MRFMCGLCQAGACDRAEFNESCDLGDVQRSCLLLSGACNICKQKCSKVSAKETMQCK